MTRLPRIRSLLILLTGFMVPEIHAPGQEPSFSQIFCNLSLLNPAYAGATGNHEGGLEYRNQWPDMGKAYITEAIYYNQPVSMIHGGAGLYAVNDKQANGLFNRLQISALYSYQIQFRNEITVNAGLEASWIRRSLNPSSLLLPYMINGSGTLPSSEVLTTQPRSFPDFSVGGIGSYKSWYGGISVHHLLAPDEISGGATEVKLNRTVNFLTGVNITIASGSLSRPGIILSPALFAQYSKGLSELVYGSYCTREPVFFGIWLRHFFPQFSNSAVSFQGGFLVSYFRLLYSYDLLLRSGSGLPGSGIHEVTLSYRMPYKAKRKKIKAIKCPKI